MFRRLIFNSNTYDFCYSVYREPAAPRRAHVSLRNTYGVATPDAISKILLGFGETTGVRGEEK